MAEASVGHQVSLGVEDELIKAYVRGVVREKQVKVLECLCHPEALHLVPACGSSVALEANFHSYSSLSFLLLHNFFF